MWCKVSVKLEFGWVARGEKSLERRTLPASGGQRGRDTACLGTLLACGSGSSWRSLVEWSRTDEQVL